MFDKQAEYWMSQAIVLAEQAALNNEVPVGAVVVYQQEIIGKGCNAPIGNNDPTAHAEIIALQQAAKTIGNYRLIDADLYVTLEPCAMCAGAIVHSRIRHLYFGAHEPKSGAVCSHIQLLEQPSMNHTVEVFSGVCAQQCQDVISQFFKRRRAQQKALKQQKS
jgi:tRNA(adenine34) deaminase